MHNIPSGLVYPVRCINRAAQKPIQTWCKLSRRAYVQNSKPIHIYCVIHLLVSNNIDPHVIMSLWLLQYLRNWVYANGYQCFDIDLQNVQKANITTIIVKYTQNFENINQTYLSGALHNTWSYQNLVASDILMQSWFISTSCSCCKRRAFRCNKSQKLAFLYLP